MRKTLRRLLTALATVAVLLTFAPVVLAGNQYFNCGSAVRVYLYENIINDTSDGDDRLAICVASGTRLSIGDLRDIPHTLAGNCNTQGLGHEHWNDCVSSVWVAGGWAACGYANAGYGAKIFEKVGNSTRFNIPGDQLSSIKIEPSSGIFQSCLSIPA